MDYSLEDFSKYKQYLNTIQAVLNRYFDDQKEYLCCKAGCSHCCEHGQYPYTDLEFKYLLLGFFKIEKKEQTKVIQRIQDLKEKYKNFQNKSDFSHRCPFLSDDGTCLVYDYRGLICRTFGLITQHTSGKYTLPFCHSLGLNYSEVYNSETQKIDYEKVKKQGYKNLPNAYRTNLKTLTSKDFFEEEPIIFGELKPLIEWL